VIEKPEAKALRLSRLQDVRDTFLHAWNGYKEQAWAQDELRPITGGYKSPFCGWAATLVDSLDSLWIMEFYDEFELALKEVENIDFTNTEGCQINLFETTIRHLGGLLSAFDISGGKRVILVRKAVELAEVLFTAFDTPNRMPNAHYIVSIAGLFVSHPQLQLIAIPVALRFIFCITIPPNPFHIRTFPLFCS
jgi:mannosyl-oligosaccharide alpha-1,2-mannosidase